MNDDYFKELAKRILQGAPSDEIRMQIGDQIWGAHTHHIAGKSGILDLLSPETVEWLKPVLDEHQQSWLEKHPQQYGVDLRNRKQGGHIQSLAEAVSKATREWFTETRVNGIER